MRMVYVGLHKIICYLHKYRDAQMICVIRDRKESKNVTFQFYRLEKKKT